MKKFLTMILIFVMMLSIVACGGDKKADEPAADAKKADEAAADVKTDEAAGEKSAEGMSVYFLTKILGNQYWAVVEEGATDAAEELGVTLTILGLNNDTEIEKQYQQLQDAQSSQADAIVIGPVDSKALTNPVKEVYESGMPIVLVDTLVDGEDFSAALVTNNVTAGEIAAEEMIRLLKEMGVKEGRGSDRNSDRQRRFADDH